MSIAEKLGGTPHLSPLLRRARSLGLADAPALFRLAVKRGCRHYTPPDYDPSDVSDPGREQLSDAELAIALISGAQIYDSQHIRCAAQLFGSPGIDPARLARLARLAVMERCTPVLRQIAEAGTLYDTAAPDFWGQILQGLPPGRPPRPGILPHPSRYVSLPGFTRSGAAPVPAALWLRPSPGR